MFLIFGSYLLLALAAFAANEVDAATHRGPLTQPTEAVTLPSVFSVTLCLCDEIPESVIGRWTLGCAPLVCNESPAYGAVASNTHDVSPRLSRALRDSSDSAPRKVQQVLEFSATLTSAGPAHVDSGEIRSARNLVSAESGGRRCSMHHGRADSRRPRDAHIEL